jgi:hypothetical protein
MMYKPVILAVLIFFINNLFAQNILIENVNTNDYPAIEIFVSTETDFKLEKQNTKIFENNISIDFVIDSVDINNENQNNNIFLIFDIQSTNNLIFLTDEIIQSLNLFESSDMLNIAFVVNDNSENYFKILSSEFSNDFDFFKNAIVNDKIKFSEKKSQNTCTNLLKAIEFVCKKEILSKSLKIIWISDNIFSDNEFVEECIEKSKKNNISVNFILLKSDSNQKAEVENLIAEQTSGTMLRNADSAFAKTVEYLLNQNSENSGNNYKITFIVSGKYLVSEMVFEFGGSIIEKSIEKPKNKIKYFQYFILGILVLTILIISYLLFQSKLKIKNLFKLNNNQIIEELKSKNKELEEKIARYKSNKSFFIPEFKDFNPSLTLFGAGGEIPIIMVKNKEFSKVFDITKPSISIGRNNDNDLIINDFAVSGKHAYINNEGGEFYIIDIDSTNGVFVNDLKITKSKISVNDIIRVGNTYLKIKF